MEVDQLMQISVVILLKSCYTTYLLEKRKAKSHRDVIDKGYISRYLLFARELIKKEAF